MSHRHVQRALLGVAGGFLRWTLAGIVSVLFASTPDDALASCGDYVTVGGTHGDRSPFAASPGSRGVPVCSGPHCQRQVPLSPAHKPVAPSGPHESACPIAAAYLEAAEPSARVDEPVLWASQAVVAPPDRPPRRAL